MEDTVIPVKFLKKLSIDEIEKFAELMNDFAISINTDVEFISYKAVAKRIKND